MDGMDALLRCPVPTGHTERAPQPLTDDGTAPGLGLPVAAGTRPVAFGLTGPVRRVALESAGPVGGMTETLSFGYDGDHGVGGRLLSAALRGVKTATCSLAVEYLSGDPLPRVGERVTLVDHDGKAHGMAPGPVDIRASAVRMVYTR